MTIRTSIRVGFCSALLLTCSGALAAGTGMYLSVGLGMSQSSFDTASTLTGAPAGTAISLDRWAFSFKEAFGYQFNETFAAELSYTSLGKYDMTVTRPGAAPATGKVTIGGFGLAGVATKPINKDIAMFVKLGAVASRISASTSVAVFRGGTVGSETDNKVVPHYGLGLKYGLSPSFALTAELERFQGMGSGSRTFSTDTNLFTIGLTYQF